MKRALVLLSVLALSSLTVGLFAQQKPRIAVIKIENKSPYGSNQIGPALEDWLVEGLVQSGKFRVMERKDLESVLTEQGLSLSGAVDEKTAVQAGKLLGCQLVVLGAVTDFSVKKSGASGAFGLGFDVGKTTAEGTVNVKMVNTTTAEIVYTGSETGKDTHAKVSVASFGGGTDYDEGQARKIFQPCIQKITAAIVAKAEAIQGSLGSVGMLAGKIAKVAEGKIYLNLGSVDGVKEGDTFSVIRLGEAITDPDTGTLLGQEKSTIGTVTVTKIVGDHLSIAVVESGSKPQVGDAAEKK